MFDKMFLVTKIVNTLQKNDYEVFLTQGSFDIAARRENLLLIKTLLNADALTSDQALSLRAISHFVSAHPFVVSLKNNREFLDNEIIYSRFDLPVLTPDFFEDVIIDETEVIHSAKGRHTIDVNSFALREKREELGMTLSQLAESVGITKKALYEIENKRVNPTEETVKRLESFLKIKLRIPYEMKYVDSVYLQPRDEFQKRVSKEFSRIGIDNSSVYSSPFEIVGKGNSSLITNLSDTHKEIANKVDVVKNISKIFNAKAFFVVKKSEAKSIDGLKIFHEAELQEIENTHDFSKIIDEV